MLWCSTSHGTPTVDFRVAIFWLCDSFLTVTRRPSRHGAEMSSGLPFSCAVSSRSILNGFSFSLFPLNLIMKYFEKLIWALRNQQVEVFASRPSLWSVAGIAAIRNSQLTSPPTTSSHWWNQILQDIFNFEQFPLSVQYFLTDVRSHHRIISKRWWLVRGRSLAGCSCSQWFLGCH